MTLIGRAEIAPNGTGARSWQEKVNKSKNNVILVANVVRRALGLSLPEEATRIETLYGAGPDKRLKKAG